MNPIISVGIKGGRQRRPCGSCEATRRGGPEQLSEKLIVHGTACGAERCSRPSAGPSFFHAKYYFPIFKYIIFYMIMHFRNFHGLQLHKRLTSKIRNCQGRNSP